jgi:hypothetical protein
MEELGQKCLVNLKTMKMKQLLPRTALLVALSMLIGTSAHALTISQAKAVRKAVTSVPVPEMGSKAVELILQAEKQDREMVAVTAVRAIVFRYKASAPSVVATVAKAAPDVAAAVAAAASELSRGEATQIATAATVAAPGQTASINDAVSHTLSGFSPVSAVNTRGAADGSGPSSGSIGHDTNPINDTDGGRGDGNFPTFKPNKPSAPHPKDYSKPRS